MSNRKTFLSAVLAGACIAFGCVAFLSLESKLAGAFFFTVGLFCICSFGFNLFTGKVCYLFQNDKAYAFALPVIWLGNLAGAWTVAVLVRLTRIAAIAEKAATLCSVKSADSLTSLFVLGLFCNLFIYLAVEGYREIPYALGKYLALFFGVMVFILCGYEHCVADMFYFSAAGCWSADTLLRLLVVTLGNAAGGVALPLARRWIAQGAFHEKI